MKRAAVLPCVVLAACGGAPAGDSYFPLDGGHRWVYDVLTSRDRGEERETLVLSTLDRADLDGAPAYRRRSDSGLDYWLKSDDSGIYRVAMKTDLEAEPTPDPERRYVLKLPLKPGTEWQASTVAYLLERRQGFPREIRHSHKPVAMNYTIEALGEPIETRAGRFADCLRVKGRASMRLYADAVAGWVDLPLVTTEWYCKGVGLVRLVREETVKTSNFLAGGTLTMELTSWN